MFLHTDTLTMSDFYDAKRAAHVDFLNGCEEKGSRTRKVRFKFRLGGYTSHRYANSGRWGAQTWDGNAATWDEWGIFLNVLFQRDPEAHGGPTSYLGLEGFRHQTGGRFDTLAHANQHPNHNWSWDHPTNVSHCACGASKRYDQPEGLRLVKHGIVRPTDMTSVERWLEKEPA